VAMDPPTARAKPDEDCSGVPVRCSSTNSFPSWAIAVVVVASVAILGVAAVLIYRYKTRATPTTG